MEKRPVSASRRACDARGRRCRHRGARLAFTGAVPTPRTRLTAPPNPRQHERRGQAWLQSKTSSSPIARPVATPARASEPVTASRESASESSASLGLKAAAAARPVGPSPTVRLAVCSGGCSAPVPAICGRVRVAEAAARMTASPRSCDRQTSVGGRDWDPRILRDVDGGFEDQLRRAHLDRDRTAQEAERMQSDKERRIAARAQEERLAAAPLVPEVRKAAKALQDRGGQYVERSRRKLFGESPPPELMAGSPPLPGDFLIARVHGVDGWIVRVRSGADGHYQGLGAFAPFFVPLEGDVLAAGPWAETSGRISERAYVSLEEFANATRDPNDSDAAPVWRLHRSSYGRPPQRADTRAVPAIVFASTRVWSPLLFAGHPFLACAPAHEQAHGSALSMVPGGAHSPRRGFCICSDHLARLAAPIACHQRRRLGRSQAWHSARAISAG
jgi:hypothetical protein